MTYTKNEMKRNKSCLGDRHIEILKIKQTIRNLHQLNIQIPNQLLVRLHELIAPNIAPYEDIPF